jgi:hypothetical protein
VLPFADHEQLWLTYKTDAANRSTAYGLTFDDI